MNHSMTIHYPETLPDTLHMSREEFEQEALLAMAVKLFEAGKLSSGQAARLAKMPRADFLRELGRFKVSPIQIDPADLESDAASASRACVEQAPEPDWAARRLTALERAREKFGHLLSSSEEFAAAKQEEIDLEESRFDR